MLFRVLFVVHRLCSLHQTPNLDNRGRKPHHYTGNEKVWVSMELAIKPTPEKEAYSWSGNQNRRHSAQKSHLCIGPIFLSTGWSGKRGHHNPFGDILVRQYTAECKIVNSVF